MAGCPYAKVAKTTQAYALSTTRSPLHLRSANPNSFITASAAELMAMQSAF